MRAISQRSLTVAYVTALVIVAAMSLASHLMLHRVLDQSQGAASVVNVSGRQRMLSQRIASLSAQLARGDTGVRTDLSAAIDRFAGSHRALLDGSQALHLPSADTNPALHAIYTEGAHPLNDAVAAFVAQARTVAALEPSDPLMEAALAPVFAAARQPLLGDLDAIVKVHEDTSRAQMTTLQRMQTASLVVVLVTLLGEAFGIFQPMVRRVAAYSRDLLKIAAVDPLTGALNRRSFTERAQAEMQRAQRHGRPVSVLMLDADHFKSVNDRYGHAGGDAVLCALVKAVEDTLRPTDLLGRFGGEEFAVVLPDADIDGARRVAERMRERIAALRVEDPTGSIAFTVSIGAAAADPGTPELQDLLDRADTALYAAKAQGRNRVIAAPPPAAPLSVAGTMARTAAA